MNRIPTDVYIIFNSENPTSVEYKNECIGSIDELENLTAIEIDWPMDIEECWKRVEHIGIHDHGVFNMHPDLYPGWNEGARNTKAESITLAHIYVWDLISESGKAACVVEHDFIFRNDINIRIPDGFFVGLGYKSDKPEYYKIDPDDINDKPKEIVLTERIFGAHGYAITAASAIKLLKDVRLFGIKGWVDCVHFQCNHLGHSPLLTAMLSPPPGIAWLRESTIWDKQHYMNYKTIDSFNKRFNKIMTYKHSLNMSKHPYAVIKK